MKRTLLIIIAILLVVCLVCLLIIGFILEGDLPSILMRKNPGEYGLVMPSPDPTPTLHIVPYTSDGALNAQQEESNASPLVNSLEILEQTVVPTNNLPELVRQLAGKPIPPLTIPSSMGNLPAGARQTFWVNNVDNERYFQISATLQHITPHAYFWIQDEVSFTEGDLRQLGEVFESEIYPTVRNFFGSEWSPGVDGDSHLHILFARGLGRRLNGYYSSNNEFHPLVHKYSNAREMILLNADRLRLDQWKTYGTLAHEYQHMIHWNRDKNEETWLNEGASELAAFLTGYDEKIGDVLYISDPDIQLNDWPVASENITPHYRASFLYLVYIMDRFGGETAQALIAHPENGAQSIDELLSEVKAFDPLTSREISADDIFLDWVLASYLQDTSLADGRYGYRNYSMTAQPAAVEVIRTCPHGGQSRDVHQYGVDYIRITCQGNYSLEFEGSVKVGITQVNAHSGDFVFWSNRGDEADMTLTRTFDFTAHSGPLTLSYWAWFDLEAGYDYLYLETSLDGETWEILTTPSSVAENPSGNNFGWGYSGSSFGWIQEKIDLSRYAGQSVQVRFQYITDGAVNGEGFLLDDVEIPEIGYSTGFEADNSGWEASGWARMDNVLPQTFRLAMISLGETTTVKYIPLQPDNTANISFQVGEDVEEVVLVVAGTTRFTRQKAAYRFSLVSP